MLRLTTDTVANKGLLGAIVATGTDYLRQEFKQFVRASLEEPVRTIVHRAPHIDEYFAELMFRTSTDGSTLLPEFRELALFSETDDHSAESYWPGSAVFGMKPKSPRLQSLPLHLYDEHDEITGRSAPSCLAMVVQERFTQTPPIIEDLISEINVIDSSGKAHPQHLGNYIKLMHGHRYFMGETPNGDKVERGLDEHWKWALVNGLLSAAIWALHNQIEFHTSSAILSMLERFKNTNPLKDHAFYEDAVKRLYAILKDEPKLAQATLKFKGRSIRQQLLLPYMAFAATQCWGEEIAYFLVEPLLEAEIAGQIGFSRVQTLVKNAMEARPPLEVHEADISITPWIVKDCRFRGCIRVGYNRDGSEICGPAPSDSNLWILYCSTDGTFSKAKAALDAYLAKKNYGVGLILMENRSEGTKALSRCRFLNEKYFDALVDRILSREPGYWYRLNPNTPFILNGNAAHLHVPKSPLTHLSLDRICKEVYRHGRPHT